MLHCVFSKSTIVRWLANFILFAASILLTMAVVEAGLRHIQYGKQFRRIEGEGFFPRHYFISDPINGYDLAKNFPPTDLMLRDYIEIFGSPFTVSTNELGCRDRRVDRENSDILLLGDSFTMGFVPFEQTFGVLVEQLIGVRVLKCGVGGYGTRHEHHKLKKVLTQTGPPKLIIVGYYVGNDLVDDYLYPEYTVLEGHIVARSVIVENNDGKAERVTHTDQVLTDKIKQRLAKPSPTLMSRSKEFLSQHLITYNVLRSATVVRELASHLALSDPPDRPNTHSRAKKKPGGGYVFHSSNEYPWLVEAWNTHLANLQQFKQSADDINAKLLIVIIPTWEQVYASLRPSGQMLDWEAPNRRLTEFFEKEGISFIDLLPEFRRLADPKPKSALNPIEDLYWSRDFHWNIKGNLLAGLLISHYVLEQSFLDVADREKRLSEIKRRLAIDFEKKDILDPLIAR